MCGGMHLESSKQGEDMKKYTMALMRKMEED